MLKTALMGLGWLGIATNCIAAGRSIAATDHQALLDKFAPIIIPHDGPGEATVTLERYLNGARLCGGGSDEGKPVSSPNGDETWTAQELKDWLADEKNAERSRSYKIKPPDGLHRPEGKERERLTRDAIDTGKGVFGHVLHLKDDLYSVKYFHFRVWNETDIPSGEGNHEGDWLCIDLQVKGDTVADAVIEYAIFHNHGRQILVPREALTMTEDGRPKVFLELGTHEPWPNAGGAMKDGWPRGKGVKTNRPVEDELPGWVTGPCEGASAIADLFGKKIGKCQLVREHEGRGEKDWAYDTRTKTVNLGDKNVLTTNLDAWLFMHYRGQWGEDGDDDLELFSGQKVTNPESPRWQSDVEGQGFKMWDRGFVSKEHQANPASAPGWKDFN